MDAAPHLGSYAWRGGREAMLRFGDPAHGPVVVALPALFEEANRTRTLLVDVLRRLAARGMAGALPDLPGQNESLLPTRAARLSAWRDAFSDAVASLPGPSYVLAVRGGALVDGTARTAGRWYLSPASGAAQVRELERLRIAGGGEDYAGNDIDSAMIADLGAAEPMTLPPLRVARLTADPRPADVVFDAAAPWRATEPRADAALAQAIADDVAAWIDACAG